ncbi:hypothetical protein HP440_06245 [Bacillus altitudinis]|uniref:hypothetical protein n=1 Tax=Bacillus altitudinis TaxID=293387 RepID=UPI000D7CA346|nr:hypothetical protein [Bacillus altitudinis]NQD50092.1 hypothetical protein [Bacillus altitudinis]PYH25677.1 hypothetical protein US8_03480 [Bacillus altitudinis]
MADKDSWWKSAKSKKSDPDKKSDKVTMGFSTRSVCSNRARPEIKGFEPRQILEDNLPHIESPKYDNVKNPKKDNK